MICSYVAVMNCRLRLCWKGVCMSIRFVRIIIICVVGERCVGIWCSGDGYMSVVVRVIVRVCGCVGGSVGSDVNEDVWVIVRIRRCRIVCIRSVRVGWKSMVVSVVCGRIECYV